MLYDISIPSELMDILDKIEQSGWREMDRLDEFNDPLITSSRDVARVCSAISNYMSTHDDPYTVGSPLPKLLSLLSIALSEVATKAVHQQGLPLLRELIRQSIDEGKGDPNYVLYALNLLTSYQQPEDLVLLKRLTSDVFNPDYYTWAEIFLNYTGEFAKLAPEMIDVLRDLRSHPLILIAYLQAVNEIARSSGLEHHPFDTEEGKILLRHWLTRADRDILFALHAVASLPFISEPDLTTLFERAQAHPDNRVKLEIARSQAQLGNENGVNTLRFYTLSMPYSMIAQNYLYDLGHLDKIPDKARDPDFQGMSIMAQWLTEHEEFACPPDTLEVVDHRKLIWPGCDFVLDLRLVKFIYKQNPYGQSTAGVGLVGARAHPITLFFVDTLSLANEELYALYYSWVEGCAHKGQAFNLQKAIEDGKTILAEHNNGF